MHMILSATCSPVEVTNRSFADVGELRLHGAMVCRDFLDAQTCTQLEEWWKKIKLGIESGDIARQSVHTNVRSGTLTKDEIFDGLHRHSKFLALAREYLGEDVCHVFSRLMVKDKFVTGPVECHQDWPYFNGDTK